MPVHKQALVIERGFMPAMMGAALGQHNNFSLGGYHAYLDAIHADAGNPSDPVDRMLLDQLAMAHLRAAQLQAFAGTAEGLEAIKLYNSAAARLLSEFRQTALALKTYREPGTGCYRRTPPKAQESELKSSPGGEAP
jgi:hypothetical protein